MSAKWPTSVATDADLYTAVNLLQTTLSGSINSAVTTITLASTTGFPTAGAVTIDNEVIFYTNVSGATITGCTRGADGTTAASHSSGVPVGATIVAYHHNGLMAEIEAIETDINARFGRGASSNAVLVPSGVTFEVDSKIGIGGAATEKLHIFGTAVSTNYFAQVDASQTSAGAGFGATSKVGSSSTGFNLIQFGSTAGGTCAGITQASTTRLRTDTGVTGLIIDVSDAGSIFFATNDTLAVTIDSSQHVIFAQSFKFSTAANKAVVTASSQATADRTFTIPDISGNGTFAFLEGAQSWTAKQTFTAAAGNPIHGTNTNDSAAAGYVGEVIQSAVTFTNFPTSAQYGDLTSISLTAGDWIVYAQICQIQNGATVATATLGISTTSGNSGTGLSDGDSQLSFVPCNSASGSGTGFVTKHVQVASTTTHYLKYTSSYTVGTPQAAGKIMAVRIR